MQTAPTEVLCTCKRSFTHCRKCGKRNPYVKKLRSMDLSIELGERVVVYRCQRCSAETHTGMPCTAPMLNEFDSGDYSVYVKPKPTPQTPLWGGAMVGSVEHAAMLSDWVIEQQKKHGWGSVQVYVEAQKAGWHLEAFADKLDEDVRKALEERGLIPASPSQPVVPQEPIDSGISLDEIIKNMRQEGSE